MVTIADIAKEAGVTKTTASLVLGGRPCGTRVSQAMRERILEIAQRLDYMPSYPARSLASGKTGTLGFVCGEIESPHFSELAALTMEAVTEQGYQLLLTVTRWDIAAELAAVDMLLERRVEGLLMFTSALRPGTRQFAYIHRHRIPVITEEDGHRSFTRIAPDWKSGVREAVAYLKSCDRRRILFLRTPRRKTSLHGKSDSLRKACDAEGLKLTERALPSLRTEDAYEAGRKLARQSSIPPAIFVFSDITAMAVLRGLRDEGVEVPGRTAVIGFDGTRVGRLSGISLSSIAPPIADMTRDAVDLLLKMIEKPASIKPRLLRFPTRFLRGESA